MRFVSALMLSSLILMSASVSGQTEDIGYSEQTFDFGHVGIEFRIFRTYQITNNSDHEIKISRVNPSCDCTSLGVSDSLMSPGESVDIRLDYNTRDAYGPTTRSFSLEFEGADRDSIRFFYTSNIGQWFGGIKPEPFSLFFLQGSDPKKVSIPNRAHRLLELSLVEKSDDYLLVDIRESKARKGDNLEVEVRPIDGLSDGTYYSSFTLAVTHPDYKEPIRLTIPVKIVKY